MELTLIVDGHLDLAENVTLCGHGQITAERR
jgi:hypothetical protein